MSATGLDVFDTTLQKTNGWLRELTELLGGSDKHRAYLALRATLHALRDRLTVEEVAQLGAQLPMLIRGFYYEGWDPSGKPLKARHIDEFLNRIEEEFRADDGIALDRVARAVFRVLSMHLTEGEIEDVKATLPTEIRQLWP
jgi:uncharacterized protein (DUF2267 family)